MGEIIQQSNRIMSRTAKGVKNVFVTMSLYFVSMLLAFFSRKIFIDYLGEDLMGLSTTVLNILGFLNLAELGITSAIATALYKPLYENNKKVISDIVSIFNYLYYIVGTMIFVAGIILSFFLPQIFKNTVDIFDIYITYFAFFISMLITYFVSYKQLLLTADQRNYVVMVWTKAFQFIKVICQIVALFYFDASYITWIVFEFIFGIVYGFWINTRVSKYYPWLDNSFSVGRKTILIPEYKMIFKRIGQIIPHKLGGFVLGQTDNIVLFAVTSSLAMITIYNNYLILIGSVVLIFSVSSTGLYAGVGNLVAHGNQKNSIKLFYELSALYFFIGGVVTITISFLTQPFVVLWLGDKFLLDPVICYLILLNTVIGVYRIPVEMFLNGYILYKDIWAPIVEATLNLGLSIILGIKFGLIGVVLGTTVSLLIIPCIWRPIFLFREGFKISIRRYVFQVFTYLITLLLAYFLIRLIVNSSIMFHNDSFLFFFINAFIIFVFSVVIYGTLIYAISNDMRSVVGKGITLMQLKLKR